MNSPYSDLPPKAYWRNAVAEREPLDPGELYVPRFPINKRMRIVTAGSCFAQHVGRTLRKGGFNVLDVEPAPAGISDEAANRFGYRLYSARYGNIYTSRQLLQLLKEAWGEFTPADPVWERKGRYFDALRPSVEPDGLDTPELVMEHRKLHLEKVREAFAAADLFVFTFGLTETWSHRATGTVYPTAPGTIAGTFDPEVHAFTNLGFQAVLADFREVRQRLVKLNPKIRFMLTVSPVPLTATASGQHVEVATCYSKAVLRAVVGTLYEESARTDYFPSYETITSLNNRGVYFEANKRSVSKLGVETAMGLFMRSHGAAAEAAEETPARRGDRPGKPAGERRQKAGRPPVQETEDLVCEDALLDAFAR
ncbi:MAG: GSCFA domain-containing protein [Paracoccaceae bacterium]|nr:MAG: GSCFA domain-containing protein [Paracoccaceae bacterium]